VWLRATAEVAGRVAGCLCDGGGGRTHSATAPRIAAPTTMITAAFVPLVTRTPRIAPDRALTRKRRAQKKGRTVEGNVPCGLAEEETRTAGASRAPRHATIRAASVAAAHPFARGTTRTLLTPSPETSIPFEA
jgi:hypothetical protein